MAEYQAHFYCLFLAKLKPCSGIWLFHELNDNVFKYYSLYNWVFKLRMMEKTEEATLKMLLALKHESNWS